MVQKVIAKVKVDIRQTGQKQYAPVHSIRGHKKLKLSKNYKLVLLLQNKQKIFSTVQHLLSISTECIIIEYIHVHMKFWNIFVTLVKSQYKLVAKIINY